MDIPAVCIDACQAHQSLRALKANKADPHDAAGLVQLAKTGFYKKVYVNSPAAHGARSVITTRNHVVESQVQLDNMIREPVCDLRLQARSRSEYHQVLSRLMLRTKCHYAITQHGVRWMKLES